jgi:hypothetical protein
LLVITDEPHGAASAGDVVDCGGEVAGACHAGLVDHDEGARADAAHPRGRSPLAPVDVPDELGEGVGVGADLLTQHCGGGRGGCQADDVAAAGGPRTGQHAHGDGLAGAGRGEGQLHGARVGRELADELHLARVEGDVVGCGFEQVHIQGGRVDGVGAVPLDSSEDGAFCFEDRR